MDNKTYKNLLARLRSTHRGERVSELLDCSADAITDLMIENEALHNVTKYFKTHAEVEVTESRRWAQVCEAQNKQIDRLQTQVENTAKELEALKKDYREFRIDAWNTMYDMLGAGGYVDRDIKGFLDRWRKR